MTTNLKYDCVICGKSGIDDTDLVSKTAQMIHSICLDTLLGTKKTVKRKRKLQHGDDLSNPPIIEIDS